jgi:uncharacterized protein (UPF0335 family)
MLIFSLKVGFGICDLQCTHLPHSRHGAGFFFVLSKLKTDTTGKPMTATEQLTAYAERLERILDEIESLKDGLKDLKAEIKSSGFNVRALERIVAIRRKDTADQEAEFLNDVLLYAHATGTHIDLVAPEPNQVPEPVL